jgi:hypothetical protein
MEKKITIKELEQKMEGSIMGDKFEVYNFTNEKLSYLSKNDYACALLRNATGNNPLYTAEAWGVVLQGAPDWGSQRRVPSREEWSV